MGTINRRRRNKKKNKKKAEKMFAENPFEKVLQEKHALAAAKEAAAKEDGDDDDDDDDDKHTALNGHTVAARRLLNFKPKKYQDNGIGDSPSSPDSSRFKRLSWNLKAFAVLPIRRHRHFQRRSKHQNIHTN